jgi:hypothetical protein
MEVEEEEESKGEARGPRGGLAGLHMKNKTDLGNDSFIKM